MKTGSSQGYFHHYYRPGRVLVPSLPCQIETLIETIAALISLKLHYPLIYYTYTYLKFLVFGALCIPSKDHDFTALKCLKVS